ncbi:MAG: hypothetical protein LBL82_04235 [Oscillospiraceae bacterium]|jgi:nitroreductase|nr:hypothetical protein [Oscillospiraceae bacterium]
MTRKEAIVARRSVRNYTGEPMKEELIDEIQDFIGTIRPLDWDIRTTIEILDSEDFDQMFKGIMVPRASHYLVIRSATKEGYLENAGFIGQQIVLFMTQKEIGTCWCGGYMPRNDNTAGDLPYVVTICFGRSDNSPPRRSAEEAKRKHLHEIVFGKITTELLDYLEAGRLAPSAMNWQPVRYKTQGTNIYVYRKKPLFSIAKIEESQCIDVGTAMANIYVAANEKCDIVREKNYPTPSGNCVYEYTITLRKDD